MKPCPMLELSERKFLEETITKRLKKALVSRCTDTALPLKHIYHPISLPLLWLCVLAYFLSNSWEERKKWGEVTKIEKNILNAGHITGFWRHFNPIPMCCTRTENHLQENSSETVKDYIAHSFWPEDQHYCCSD